ncbi:glycosyltransferase [bacterium]|nr:glycosyltransferase [bacterium]MBU1614114.1 glycosyltransferase [bacterium]
MEDNLFKQNLRVLEKSFPGLAKKVYETEVGDDIILITAKDGSPTAKIRIQKGEILLHSRVDPVLEAERVVKRAVTGETGKDYLLMGLGLGYTLFELLGKIEEQASVIVIEKRLDLFKLSLSLFDYRPILKAAALSFLIGKEPEDVAISANSIQVIKHLPSINLYPDYYCSVLGQESVLLCRHDIRDRIKQAGDYRKFASPALRILTFELKGGMSSQILSDCFDAFAQLGHQIKVIPANRLSRFSLEETLSREIAEFRPDFVFTLSHLHLFPGLLETMKMPTASWFVDDPFIWLNPDSFFPHCALFVWDRSYIPSLKDLGASSIFYLPLATNPAIFKKKSLSEAERVRFEANISFVGQSLYGTYYRDFFESGVDLHPALGEIIQFVAKDPLTDINDILTKVEEKFGQIPFRDKAQKEAVLYSLEQAAMTLHRKNSLLAVAGFGLKVYGDEGWKRLLGEKAACLPWIDYRGELPLIYAASKINLNLTKAQMKQAVTQRVFDVPAVGGFLLTDYRADLEELFDFEKEIASFKSEDELFEKTVYFLSRRQEREKIAHLAHKRVLACHTYQHRMQEMINKMRKVFG